MATINETRCMDCDHPVTYHFIDGCRKPNCACKNTPYEIYYPKINQDITYPEFAKEWIESHVSTNLYPEMKQFLWELVLTFSNQQHSGSSAALLLHYFNKLNEEWSNPK